MLYGEINRQRLKIINEHVVADTIDYLEARFAFSEEWNGLEKWVHFAKDGEVYDIRLTDDCVRKEDHLNLSAGIWKVYLHGNEFSGGKVIERITTNAAILKVEPTGTLDGEPFPEMPASVTEQILARLHEVEQNGGGSGDGYSPEAKVERVEGGVRVTITDKDGTTSEVVQDGKPGVHVGSDAPPAGTRVWVNPSGKRTEFPRIDDTLTQPGYAADAAKVGRKFEQISEAKADYASVPNKATVDGSTLKMQRETTTTDEAGTETTETTDLFEVELPSGGDCWTIDELTAETVIANDDAVPFYDTSAKGQRKTLWSNIKAVLKTYFDGVYLKRSGDSMQGTLNLNGNLVMPFDKKSGIRDNTDNPVMRYETINNEASLRLGHRGVRFHVLSSERPMYNGLEFAIKNDIPDTYNKAQIDAIMGSYVNDIDGLIGGDA